MRPLPANHVPALRACRALRLHHALPPRRPVLLALVGVLHMTKLHVVTASVQFSVCDIFTGVHAHGYGSCLWDYGFSGPAGGGALEISLMGECVYCEIFIWKVNMLPTSSFAELKIPGLIEINVNHLVNQYFQFLLEILNIHWKLL